MSFLWDYWHPSFGLTATSTRLPLSFENLETGENAKSFSNREIFKNYQKVGEF